MLNRIRPVVAAVVIALAGSRGVIAQDTTQAAPAKPNRAELRERQLDVTLEARDIERILTKLKRASELSKTRIAEAAKVAESASTALDRGDDPSAHGDAKQATAMFREIVKLLEALLAEETPQRIAAARNLANQLARTERQFAQQFKGAKNPTQAAGKGKLDPNSEIKPKGKAGGEGQGNERKKDDEQPAADGSGKPNDEAPKPEEKPNEVPGGQGKPRDDADPKNEGDNPGEQRPKPSDEPNKNGGGGDMTEEERREALARRAEELARTGETLKDILNAIAQSTEPADKEAVEKVQAALKETDLMKAIEAMTEAADMIRSGQLDETRLSALDIADRMEITAQRLDSAYRAIVAPQAEELRKLEQALADLREKMDELETQAQVAAWHREARELLDRAEQLGISEKAREDFLDQMKKAGLSLDGTRNDFKWAVINDRYRPPEGYSVALIYVQEEIQARIQTLLLGDFASSPDEKTPPKYQDLVDRYYEVLSRDRTRKSTPPTERKAR